MQDGPARRAAPGAARRLEFAILGALEVRDETGAGVPLGGTKPRAMLAMLLLHANAPVSWERLALGLWGEDAPANATKTLQVHGSRLRKALGDPAIIATTPGGYRLRVGSDALDATRFERLVEEGRGLLAARRFEQAVATLRRALALWRGPALEDLAFEPFAATEVARLEERRLAAVELCVEAGLGAGRHAQLVCELRSLLAAHPTRERFAAQLMLALYRCGRQTEALDVYRAARAALVSQLGLEPGHELRELHEAILRHDDVLALERRPRDLPPELEVDAGTPFVGRGAELAWLRERWDAVRAGSGAALVVSGAPGAGKTRLAAELAAEAHLAGAEVRYGAGCSGEALVALCRCASGATSPTLVVVDDADVAEPEVLAELERLTHAIGSVSVLLVACGEDEERLRPIARDGLLRLPALADDAVRAIAASYGPRSDDVSVAALLDASGGLPGKLHAVASARAQDEAARRVGFVAGRAAAEHAQLRAIEAELTDDVLALQAAHGRVLAIERDAAARCPFKGLAAYDVADAPFFFGREKLVAELVARLVGESLLGLVGPSGSGKSSLLRAGLLPALASGVLPGSDTWAQVVIRPGAHPLRELRDATAGIDGAPRVVVAVDQFEEVFTVCRDAGERAAFIDELAGSGPDRLVVVALRADFYGRLSEHRELSRRLAANHVLVGSMCQDELRRAIACPAQRAGLWVEPRLSDALVRDVVGRPGALPLLSTVLLELWQRRDGRRLQHATYEALGGVHGAVARLAEDAFAALGHEHEGVARRVLMRLVGVGDGGTAERRREALRELEGQRDRAIAKVVDTLTERRLLTVSDGFVELAHEALLREWPRLAAWIEEDRDALRIQRNLGAAAHEWERLQRDDEALYRGARLAEAVEWNSTRNPPLGALEREFLAAGDARHRRELRARRRRVQLAFASLVLALLGVGLCALVAMHERSEAERQGDIASSRELATRAATLLATNPGLSLGIALGAVERHDTEQARNAVRQATYTTRKTGGWAAHDGWLYGAAPSGDGRLVATAGQNGRVRIWDLRRGRAAATIRAHREDVYSVELSPSSRLVASAGGDGTVAIADARSGAVVRRLRVVAAPGYVSGVAFAADERHVLLAVSDGTVRVVPVARGASRVLRGHAGAVYAARFDRGGRRIVSAGADGTARIWTLGRARPLVLRQDAEVQDAVFSPDGRLVATAAADGFATIRHAAGGGRPTRIRADRESVYSVRFSADGQRLLTAGEEGVVRLWGVRTGRLLAELKGHHGRVLQANFVPGGASVVSAGVDGLLRRWSAPDVATFAAPGALGVRVSPDGRFALTGSSGGSVRLVDLRSGAARVLRGGRGPVVARFATGGKHVVSASDDGRVRIWDLGRRSVRDVPAGSWQKFAVAYDPRHDRLALAGPRPHNVIQSVRTRRRSVLRGHTARVYDVAFSPDGRLLASASEDRTVRVWDTASGALVRTLRGHLGAVNSVAFIGDGRRLVSAGVDGTVRVWSLDGGDPLTLRGHDGAVRSALPSRDGTRIVSAGQDATVRVWDAAGGETLAVVREHARYATGADFTPDGARVASAGAEGVVDLVACEVCGSFASVLRLARTRSDSTVSAAERERYLLDDER